MLNTNLRPKKYKPQLYRLSIAAALLSIGCASPQADRNLRVYPTVAAKTVNKGAHAYLETTTGMLAGSGETISCVANLCRDLLDYEPSYRTARLKNGDFASLRAEGEKWTLRVGKDLVRVSNNRLSGWPSPDDQPRWKPTFEGYRNYNIRKMLDSKNLFLGVWEPVRRADAPSMLVLFSDAPDRRINPPGVSGPCILARVLQPVAAISSSPSLHGEMWPVTVVVRPPGGHELHALGYVLFPKSLKCLRPSDI